jgi:translation initiation factor 2 subunit 3
MENQPIVNIGMLGSVSDGKSTTVYSLTGVKTQRHSNELKRNITIKPGYANLKIYKTEGDNKTSQYNNTSGELVHHISFIDCPGHYQLIVTMMSCIKLMDGIILVVSAAEPLDSKPQLIQHIMAIKMSGLKNIIVLLNKLDLVKKPVAQKRFSELVELLKKYDIEPKVIIPVCMNHGIGVDLLLENIMKYMGPDKHKITSNPLFLVSRSFDINKVNTNYMDIEGGVMGGSLISGQFKVGDCIEIRPGVVGRKPDGTLSHKPHITTIKSLKSDTTELTTINPGGLIGIGTDIDPFYCKNDNMIGNVIGLKDCLPEVYYNITLKYNIVNFSTNESNILDKPDYISNMSLIVIIGTNSLDGKVTKIENECISLDLSKPVCIDKTDMIILCDKSSSINSSNESFNIVAYGYLI